MLAGNPSVWIDVENELPPYGVWVEMTRKLGDSVYTDATIRWLMKGQYMLDHMRDVGYTHWKVKEFKDERRERLCS